MARKPKHTRTRRRLRGIARAARAWHAADRGAEGMDYLLVVALVVVPVVLAVRVLASAMRFAYWLGSLIVDSPFM